MIHSYDMTIALAQQHRSELQAEAARHRLVRDARRAQRAGDRTIPRHRLARALNVLRPAAPLPKVRRRPATSTEATLRAVHTEPRVDLTTNVTADLAELVDGGCRSLGP